MLLLTIYFECTWKSLVQIKKFSARFFQFKYLIISYLDIWLCCEGVRSEWTRRWNWTSATSSRRPSTSSSPPACATSKNWQPSCRNSGQVCRTRSKTLKNNWTVCLAEKNIVCLRGRKVSEEIHIEIKSRDVLIWKNKSELTSISIW